MPVPACGQVFLKLGQWEEALGALEEMKTVGMVPEVQTYNLMILTCTKLSQPTNALTVYDR
jgi:pentatricopeptide repeat protein